VSSSLLFSSHDASALPPLFLSPLSSRSLPLFTDDPRLLLLSLFLAVRTHDGTLRANRRTRPRTEERRKGRPRAHLLNED